MLLASGFESQQVHARRVMKVFTISSGCVYEGGSLDSVHIVRDKAMARFNELLEKKRERNLAMEDYEAEKQEERGRRSREVGYWLEEKTTTKENGSIDIVFHGSDYLTLTVWDCIE